MVAGFFLRKADFQLREVGAVVPEVSVSRKLSSERSRHPVMVTRATFSSARGSLGVETGGTVSIGALAAIAFADAAVRTAISPRAISASGLWTESARCDERSSTLNIATPASLAL